MRFVRSMSVAAALALVTSKTTSGFLYQSWLTLSSAVTNLVMPLGSL
jgi:hypothetical protein